MTIEKIENHWGDQREISKSEMVKEVFKVGGVVLLFSSIIPLIHTIYFIVASLSNIHSNLLTNPDYLILNWIICVVSFVIPAMVSKRILFTNKRKKIKWMPLMTFGLCVLIGFAYMFLEFW